MAGVLGLIKSSQKRVVKRFETAQWVDPKALELQTAMEILAEVFGIRTSEVEEMLQQRCEEREEWPERFWIEAE